MTAPDTWTTSDAASCYLDTTLEVPVDPSQRSPSQHRPAVWVCVMAIRGYQLARTGRISLCRFTPSCSEYAAVAIDRHGVRRGLLLTIRRLGRCRPGGPFGSDPVPE